jgi:hypothetical protein
MMAKIGPWVNFLNADRNKGGRVSVEQQGGISRLQTQPFEG